MAQEGVIQSLYPDPPPFVKFFTDENIEKLERLKTENNSSTEGLELLKQEDRELLFLIPPKQPEGDSYRSFGNLWQFSDKIPKLEEMGIEKLYTEPEDKTASSDSKVKIQELRTLLKSLLLNFLEVVGVMSVAPEHFHVKVEQIRTIMINIHHLLNEYRPHQSRESLILLMEKQIDTKKNEIQEIERVCKDVEEKIKNLVKVYVDRNGELEQEANTLESSDDGLQLKIDVAEVKTEATSDGKLESQ